MNAGKIPPNWSNLVIHSSEMSTNQDFQLTQNWSSDLPPMVPEYDRKPNPGLNWITNPYAIVLDHTTATDTVDASYLPLFPTGMECEVPSDTAGLNGKSTSQMSTCENPVDSSSKTRNFQSQDSARTNALLELRSPKLIDHANEAQQMPQHINLHESGLK